MWIRANAIGGLLFGFLLTVGVEAGEAADIETAPAAVGFTCDVSSGECHCGSDDACQSAWDGEVGCGPGGHCQKHCGEDRDCPCGTTCAGGFCSAGCSDSGDCCVGTQCIDGACRGWAGPDDLRRCEDDTHCAAHFGPNVVCAESGRCERSCASDSDCPCETLCSTEVPTVGLCVPEDGPNQCAADRDCCAFGYDCDGSCGNRPLSYGGGVCFRRRLLRAAVL